MAEEIPKMEQPMGERVDLVQILKQGGLDIDQDSANRFMDSIEKGSDREVGVQFNDLLIAYDEATDDEAKQAVAVKIANAVKPYL